MQGVFVVDNIPAGQEGGGFIIREVSGVQQPDCWNSQVNITGDPDLPGQGTSPPQEKIFENHAMCRYTPTDRIYAPSYGHATWNTGSAGFAEWKNHSVQYIIGSFGGAHLLYGRLLEGIAANDPNDANQLRKQDQNW